MFHIYANGKSIYQPMDNKLSLIQPKLTLEMGKAGSLQFQVPPSNQYYNALSQLSTIVTVEMDDVEIFRGRVLTNNRNFNNIRTVYCEGNLAYLVDSVQKAEKYEGKAHALFRKIIAAHNARVEASKQFTVGNITVENRDVLLTGKSDDIEDAETGKFDYKQIALNSIADEWQNTFDFIETCLIDFTGGYLRTRRSGNTTYIDLLADYNSTATQEIEFGKNMLDLTEDVSAEDVFTVLIPLGDENLTIESVNGGSDELVDADAVARYGRIVKTHVFDSVNTPETLLENGQRFLESNVNVPVTITVKAVDMHLVDKNASAIFVGDKVHVSSVPHGMLDTLTCTKIEYDMENPANNTYTFGTPKQSLTERYRKDKAKQDSEGSRGGGGGGGAGGAAGAAEDEAKKELDEFFDAWINVDPEAAHIDLGTLYKKFKEGVEILESSCGISLDAPSGNINIKTLRQEFDDLGTQVSEQSAYIDLLNNELGARIALVASKHQELADQEASHYAELTISANDQESKIAANTENIRNLNGQMTESRTNITQLSNDLQAQIALEASHKETLEGKITTNSTSIKQVADDLSAQIKLEASHNSSQATKIASIEAKADANESAITLKADKTTINSKLTKIEGRLESAEASIDHLSADVIEVDTLITNKINGISLSSLIAKATIINADIAIKSGVSITAPIISASTLMSVNGKTVATQEYVNDKVADYATQTWVNNQGFMKTLPDTINVTKVKATAMTIGVEIVATQYWCMTTKKFATQDWVTEQLKNYAKSDHTHTGYASSTHSHAWNSITSKPTSFTPSSHKHSFSGSTSLAWGHMHTTSTSWKAGNNTGGVYNYSAKTISISGTTASN